MQIIAIIANDNNPTGWPECHTATKWDDTHADHRNQMERLVSRFNATLRPGELPPPKAQCNAPLRRRGGESWQ